MIKYLVFVSALVVSMSSLAEEKWDYRSKCPGHTLISEVEEAELNEWFQKNFHMDQVFKYMAAKKHDVVMKFDFDEEQMVLKPKFKKEAYYSHARNLFCSLTEGGAPFDENSWVCGIKDPDDWYEDTYKDIVYVGALSLALDYQLSRFFNRPEQYIKIPVDYDPMVKNYFYCLDGIVFRENTFPYYGSGH